MIIKKGLKKRIKCEICKSVKNATLLHAKRNWRKTYDDKLMGEIDTFVLHYKIGKHHQATKYCKGSEKIQKREYDGIISSEF